MPLTLKAKTETVSNNSKWTKKSIWMEDRNFPINFQSKYLAADDDDFWKANKLQTHNVIAFSHKANKLRERHLRCQVLLTLHIYLCWVFFFLTVRTSISSNMTCDAPLLPLSSRDDRLQRRCKNIPETEVWIRQEEWGESAKTHGHMPNSIHPHTGLPLSFYLNQSTMWLSDTKAPLHTSRIEWKLHFDGEWALDSGFALRHGLNKPTDRPRKGQT